MKNRSLMESAITKIVKQILIEESGEHQNELDNRLYVALKDLASLAAYLSDPKKPITNDEVNRFRNELRRRYTDVDDMIGRYAK